MESNRKRIRKSFAPLTTSVSVQCVTTASPTTQIYNAELGQYEPDRTLTPTKLRPVVIADTSDGSWTRHEANEYLADIYWYVNGVNVTTAWSTSDYEIVYGTTSDRGSIIIKKNIAPTDTATLRFKAKIADPRTGQNIPVESDDIILSTLEKAPDSYSMNIGIGENIVYDPLLDKLHLYEYKVSHGIMDESAEALSDAVNQNCYIRVIPIEVYKGKAQLQEGYSVKLYHMSGNSVITLDEVAAGTEEVIEITPTSITLDVRLVKKQAYLIKAFVDGKEVAQKQFTVGRKYRAYVVEPMNGTDIHPSATSRADRALALADGNIIDCPESIIRMVWCTDTENKKGVRHNEGASTRYLLSDTGIGNTYADSWLDTYIETSWKGAYCIATDDSGNVLTDANGNILIFN